MKYWNGVEAPHSSPWNSIGTNGRGEDEGGGDLQAPGAEQMAAALALGAVAHLIVVLQVAEEAMAGEAGGRPAVAAAAEARVAAVVDEGAREGLREVGQRAEVRVVPGALAGEHGVQGVVEIVAPLRVEAIAAESRAAAPPAGRSGRSRR